MIKDGLSSAIYGMISTATTFDDWHTLFICLTGRAAEEIEQNPETIVNPCIHNCGVCSYPVRHCDEYEEDNNE